MHSTDAASTTLQSLASVPKTVVVPVLVPVLAPMLGTKNDPEDRHTTKNLGCFGIPIYEACVAPKCTLHLITNLSPRYFLHPHIPPDTPIYLHIPPYTFIYRHKLPQGLPRGPQGPPRALPGPPQAPPSGHQPDPDETESGDPL